LWRASRQLCAEAGLAAGLEAAVEVNFEFDFVSEFEAAAEVWRNPRTRLKHRDVIGSVFFTERSFCKFAI
jgi:hypothetical protein